MYKHKNNINQGFSLIELSIVLVILGLLTGGILTGQNLIRAAELRSVATELQAHMTAINLFKDKYFHLPGDMPNATNFWGSAGGSGSIGDGCETSTGTGTQTCNGDGSQYIVEDAVATNTYSEMFTFWQHLSNAGFINASLTGKGNSTTHITPNENVPASKVANAGWGFGRLGMPDSSAMVIWPPDADIIQRLYILGPYTEPNFFSYYHESLFSPEEAWNIDTKMDDGLPFSGSVRGKYAGSVTTNNCTNVNRAYNLVYDDAACNMDFVID